MSKTALLRSATLTLLLAILLAAELARAEDDDPYTRYIKTSKDFQAVRQEKPFVQKSLPGLTIMPWYYVWPLGFDDASGSWCRDHGINGAFTDHGDPRHLAWIDKFDLRFYGDHMAHKGFLHLWDGNDGHLHRPQISGTGYRARPLNRAMLEQLKGFLRESVAAQKKSPWRGAYALDDEISWGHFISPCMWQVTDDAQAYPKWLDEIYGPGKAPRRDRWVSYSEFWPRLPELTIAVFDASPLMDQWTFNDSYFNNFVGELVEYANSLDPATPCGYVGGQVPTAFGGFDYVKVMRKVQFIESYGAARFVQSFNPECINAQTFFFKGFDDAVWQFWRHAAMGTRAVICWVDGKWWDGKKAQPWVDRMAPTWKEVTGKIGPLTTGARWMTDGVALYYSQPSIQLGWIMDAQSHRKTWPNRASGDGSLACCSLARKAWMNMCLDEGLQFGMVGYADLVQGGVPSRLKVLVLTHALCLSDAEARKIKEFCAGGGTVIADYLPGLWDQHGKGRAAGGVLDDMFGVRHDPAMRSSDLFNGNQLWAETDQDANFSYKTFDALLTNQNHCIKDASGFHKAVRNMKVAQVNHYGRGTAVLMNLSPQWYNAYRAAGYDAAARRETFMKFVRAAGVNPWVRIKNAGAKEFGYEIAYWSAGRRLLIFLVANPDAKFSATGGGNATSLRTGKITVTLAFDHPVANVKDERTQKALGSGKEIQIDWTMNEAAVLSLDMPGED